jgi:hypothetical protein
MQHVMLQSGVPFQKTNAALGTGTDTIDLTSIDANTGKRPGYSQWIQVWVTAVGADCQISFDNANWMQCPLTTMSRFDVRVNRFWIKGTAAGSKYVLLASCEGDSSLN